MIQQKPFQVRTAESAFKALTNPSGTRRFLIADEPGLGKTITSQLVIKLLLSKKPDLKVFYICNSQELALQNRKRLLEAFEPPGKGLLCEVDRLTLVSPVSDETKAILYSLTPGTMVTDLRRRMDGRQSERERILNLLLMIWPTQILSETLRGLFVGNCEDDTWIDRAIEQSREHQPDQLEKILCKNFKVEVEKELEVATGYTGQNPFALDKELLGEPREGVNTALSGTKYIGRLRRALAMAVLKQIEPDLIIFDEFQNFSDWVKPPEEGEDLSADKGRVNELLDCLRGSRSAQSAGLLLLSATPYKLDPYHHEGIERDAGVYESFIDLFRFLSKNLRGEEEALTKALTGYQQALTGLDWHRNKSDYDQVIQAKTSVEGLLKKYVSRTERPQAKRVEHKALKTDLKEQDLGHLDNLYQATRGHAAAVRFWRSIPYPLQAGHAADYKLLGQNIDQLQQVLRKAKLLKPVESNQKPKSAGKQAKASSGTKPKQVLHLPEFWEHPKMRALEQEVKELLDLPWIAPSRPRFDLSGPWKEAIGSSKLLIFSYLRATPRSIAALLSARSEATGSKKQKYLFEQKTGYRSDRMQGAMWELVYLDSPFLSQLPGMPSGEKELLALAKGRDIEIKEVKKRKFPWNNDLAKTVLTFIKLLSGQTEAEQSQKFTTNHLAEVSRLAAFAPLVSLRRVWERYFPRGEEQFESIANQLKKYLLSPQVMAKHLGTNMSDRPQYLLAICEQGDLESVLDEYLWQLSSQGNTAQEAADQLIACLELKAVPLTLASPCNCHPKCRCKDNTCRCAGQCQCGFSLRSHVARPFAQSSIRQVSQKDPMQGVESETEETLTTERLRLAFNSPFFPHVLASTSVGQEGLDFHLWCSRILHWDLPPSPILLEQREGRVQRHGSLAIRRALAQKYRELGESQNEPWRDFARRIEQDYPEEREDGLSPWWTHPGADVECFRVGLPFGEEEHRYEHLQEQRMIYRFVLGHPDPSILMRHLHGAMRERKKEGELDEWQKKLQALAIDLSH